MDGNAGNVFTVIHRCIKVAAMFLLKQYIISNLTDTATVLGEFSFSPNAFISTILHPFNTTRLVSNINKKRKSK